MSYPNYIEYLANRRIWAVIKKEVRMASQTVINQMQQIFVSTSSSAIVAQASANTAANHVTTSAAHAATASASAAEAAAIAQEIYNGNYGNGNQALIDKIEYLFGMFYHSDSETIMENYPLFL